MREYIDKGYIIVSEKNTIKKIKKMCPDALTFDYINDSKHDLFKTNQNKFLIDVYCEFSEIVKIIEADNRNSCIFFKASNHFFEKTSKEYSSLKNNDYHTLKACELVLKMGDLALEVQCNEYHNLDCGEKYSELGKIIKKAYKDMHSVLGDSNYA